MPLPKSVPAMDLVIRFNAGEKAARDKVKAALKQTGTADGASKILGIGRSTVFKWLSENEDLRKVIGDQKPGRRPKLHAATKK